MALRCLLVDDFVPFLEAARSVLEPGGIEIVAAATTGREALALAHELRPDLVLVDVQLRDESGIDVARRLAGSAQPPVVILISTRDREELAELIESAPVRGFIQKHRLSADGVRALI